MAKSLNKFLSGWYLIYTRPSHEKRVVKFLSNKGINSFLPTSKKILTWKSRKKIVDLPLFPSYVFVYLNDMNEFYNGLEFDGVVQYVKFGREVATVKEAIISNIKLLSDKCGDIEITAESFRAGQQIKIMQGSLAGLDCEVVHVENKHKILVRVEMLNRNILVSISPDLITYINQ